MSKLNEVLEKAAAALYADMCKSGPPDAPPYGALSPGFQNNLRRKALLVLGVVKENTFRKRIYVGIGSRDDDGDEYICANSELVKAFQMAEEGKCKKPSS